jgi:TfoX/Sxy family transcriptional regulator of competence genes
MASKQGNVDFVLEQMAEAGPVSARKMFGEYGIYCGGKIVALFCDDQLFVKPTSAGRSFIGTPREGAPYPGAKPWLLIGGDRCEDSEWLSELVRLTARELPVPVPKARSSKKTAKKSAKKPVKKAPPKTVKKSTAARPKPAARLSKSSGSGSKRGTRPSKGVRR